MHRLLTLAALVLPLLAAGGAGGVPSRPLVPMEIAFWDARHGLAMFARPEVCKGATCAAIGRTRDGGRTWTLSAIPERWTDLVVVPGGAAWARVPPHFSPACAAHPFKCAPQPAARRSADGGRTWHIAVAGWPDLRVASFPTRSDGFAFSRDRLLRTSHGGSTWGVLRSPCQPSLPAYASFVTPARGWILCAQSPNGYHHPQALFTTHDGGSRWTLVMDAGYTSPGHSSRGAICGCGWSGGVAFARGGRGLIWESGDQTYQTSDGGRTWSGVRFTSTVDVNGVSAAQVSARTAYLLVHTVHDESWDLRRTADGGRSWRIVHVWPTQ